MYFIFEEIKSIVIFKDLNELNEIQAFISNLIDFTMNSQYLNVHKVGTKFIVTIIIIRIYLRAQRRKANKIDNNRINFKSEE